MVKNTSEKGDVLEIIVAMLEQAQTTNPTVIKRKHKIIDRDGVERELDIYFEVQVNNKVLKYAIECKNYGENSSVKISHITDFHSMIEDSGIIGILVSTGNFQEGAIQKAKSLNIDLYTVKEDPELSLKRILFQQKRRKVKDVILHSEHFNTFPNPDIEYLYWGEEKKKLLKKNVTDLFSKSTVKMVMDDPSTHFKEFFRTDDNTLAIAGGVAIEKQFPFPIDSLYFKVGEQYYPITHYTVVMDLWVDWLEWTNPKHQVYQNLSGDSVFARFVAVPLKINGNKDAHLSYIHQEGKEPKMVLCIDDEYLELELLFTLDKSGKELVDQS